MNTTPMLPKDEVKPVVRPDSLAELPQVWQRLGLIHAQPTIVIIGGAGGMSQDDLTRIQAFFEKYLVPFVIQKKGVVVEGGTNSGVMAAIGRARKLTGGDFPLVGVAARDIEQVETMLEPNHTHFILCPGQNWGDESEWIAAAASALSGSLPSVAILINGGKITWEDARLNIKYNRQVIIAEGTGRTADVIATTSTGHLFDRQAIALLRTGMLHIANFYKEPEKFIARLNDLMK